MPTVLPAVHSREGDVTFTCYREVPGARSVAGEAHEPTEARGWTGVLQGWGRGLGHLRKLPELPAEPGAAGGAGPRSETPLAQRRERGCDPQTAFSSVTKHLVPKTRN